MNRQKNENTTRRTISCPDIIHSCPPVTCSWLLAIGGVYHTKPDCIGSTLFWIAKGTTSSAAAKSIFISGSSDMIIKEGVSSPSWWKCLYLSLGADSSRSRDLFGKIPWREGLADAETCFIMGHILIYFSSDRDLMI